KASGAEPVLRPTRDGLGSGQACSMSAVRNDPRPPTGPSGPPPAAQVIALVRDYGTGAGRVRALDGLSLALHPQRFTAVMGASGSGKSTFLHCLAGLDQPTSGQVLLGETDLAGLSDSALTAIRRDRIGFVFQDGNLLPHLTAEENIDLGAFLRGRRPDRVWRAELLGRLGLPARRRQRPPRLSGGRRRRVAGARARLGRPERAVAAEPTGALDSVSGRTLLETLRACVDEYSQTVVMVTHDPAAA